MKPFTTLTAVSEMNTLQ